MRDVDIVVLSKFPEIFEGFRESMKTECDGGIVVWDNPSASHPCGDGWINVNVHRPFQMAHNGNIGLRYADAEKDVLYCSDDVRFIEPDTIKRLQALAYSDPAIGILSAKIIGLCATDPLTDEDLPIIPQAFVGFVFVYLKREMIERVGFLEEDYVGYGVEDVSYCFRARRAGFKIAVARDVKVRHGVNGHVYGSTFIPTRGEAQMAKDDQANWMRFADKWGIEHDMTKIMEFIRKG